MRETLHIFKKDVRHRWPEILISLVLLLLYLRAAPRTEEAAGMFDARSFPWDALSVQSISFLLLFLWIFLIVRVVQDEALVGDRQWWITKPYDWWKLLLAKVLIWVFFVATPLFFVQLILLHHFGFSISPNLLGVLKMQMGLAVFLFLPSLVLASLTRSLGQALIGVLAAFLLFAGITALFQIVPSSSMESAAEGTSAVQGVLVLGSLVGAVGWQYARRNTWASRGVVFGAFAAIGLIGVVTPYGKFVERKYPLVEVSESPARIVAGTIPTRARKGGMRAPNLSREVYLQIPVEVSGIPPDKVVRLDGIKAVIETPAGHRLDRGWRAQGMALWPESGRQNAAYELKPNEYEALKSETVRLHVELALREYEQTKVREIVLTEGRFPVRDLGICQLTQSPSMIACLRPFRQPGLAATFDPHQAKCEAEGDVEQIPEDRVSHVWYPPSSDDAIQPGLNPVLEYPLFFVSPQSSVESGERWKRRIVHLCPGAEVKIAKPEEKRHVRVKLEMEGVRLEDLAHYVGE
jgi:hypothetical protein